MKIFNYNEIKNRNKAYIIAEIGVNHECSIKKAKKLIYLAKKNGAHGAKFQTYKADKLASKNSKISSCQGDKYIAKLPFLLPP